MCHATRLQTGAWHCTCCEYGIPSFSQHMHPNYKTNHTKHLQYRDMSRDAVRFLAKHGPTLAHEGVAIKNKKFTCTIRACKPGPRWKTLCDEYNAHGFSSTPPGGCEEISARAIG